MFPVLELELAQYDVTNAAHDNDCPPGGESKTAILGG